jgi:hypothetical protein
LEREITFIHAVPRFPIDSLAEMKIAAAAWAIKRWEAMTFCGDVDHTGLLREAREPPDWTGSGLNRIVAHGCNCNRSTLDAIGAAGFTITWLERDQLHKAPPFVRPLIVGTAESANAR